MLHEFRQDPISGDWVLFSTERGQRPHPKEVKLFQSKEDCFFESERLHEQESPVAIYHRGQKVPDISGDWTTIVVPNKFPAVKPGLCSPKQQLNLFTIAGATGSHELVITRDHDRSFAHFNQAETVEVLTAYRDRYREIAKDGCSEYVSIFHNHGHLAGASVYHNHSQILSMPLIPTPVIRYLEGSKRYFKNNGKAGLQELLKWEIEEQKRIVYENDHFVVLCPYVSQRAYEMKVLPKIFRSDFSAITDSELPSLADALNAALKKLYISLDDPDYVFFIHTAPLKETDIEHLYSWHIEIMPRFSIDAGLELETNIAVNSIDPDDAAEILRNTQA